MEDDTEKNKKAAPLEFSQVVDTDSLSTKEVLPTPTPGPLSTSTFVPSDTPGSSVTTLPPRHVATIAWTLLTHASLL